MRRTHWYGMFVLALWCVTLPFATRAEETAADSPETDSVSTRARVVEQLAEGVHAIREPDAPDAFPQGNVTVVIGERDVLVVDSRYLPSSARRDIELIRKLTDKPVRYLVNTHWHFDHTMGNGTYAAAFPGIAIVAHAETARQMRGYNPGWFERFPQRADRLRKVLEEGTLDGRELTALQRKEYEDAAKGVAPVAAEFARLVDAMPTLTFEGTMSIDLGRRVVELRHLGRGNTLGDIVAYLPAERILATGDLLDHPVPYLGGGFPFELVGTLERMAALDVATWVPGHGAVLRGDAGKAHLANVIGFVRAATESVRREVHKRGSGSENLEAVRTAVLEDLDLPAWRAKFGGEVPENGDFFDSFALRGVIAAAYREAWGN